MISYSYNREDVLLNRLFQDQPTGTYIDVGAGHPTSGSLTRHFYELGWRGLNIEPTPLLIEGLREARPEDTNLHLALSDVAGSVEFYEFDELHWGFSTLSKEQAERHAADGIAYQTRRIPVTTLAEICREHVAGEIDFLSIDVEGHEKQVVQGGDWKRWRPKAVIIESTQPMTEIPTHDDWEPLLLEADYLFAYFDGLNRYYIRAEDSHLLEHFRTPVNIFDEFEAHETQSRLADLESLLHSARALNQDLQMSEAILLGDHQYFRDRLARLEAQYRELAGRPDQPAPAGPADSVYGLGPLGMAMARRIAMLSGRFPRLAEAARRVIRAALAVRRKLRSAR